MYRRSQHLLDDLHLTIDPHVTIRNPGIGQQQLIEIAKALSHEAKDSGPRRAYSRTDRCGGRNILRRIVNKLRDRGVAMIYISHKLEEVFRIKDRITVLRDGRTVGTNPTSEWTEAQVIARMVGREVGDIFPTIDHEHGDVLLEVRNISLADPVVAGKKLVDNVSFSVRRGEVLGIAGLMAPAAAIF